MKIGAFEVSEPAPELKNTHAIAMLRPWVDVGSVGTLILRRLERHFSAIELCRLEKPGQFFDFTRYRPMLSLVEGVRRVTVPNTHVFYVKRDQEPDFLFLHLLEPHCFSEEYVESVTGLFKTFNVQRYMMLGGMYDVVPHTRPVILTGSLRFPEGEQLARRSHIKTSSYEGPTSIVYQVAQKAQEMGLQTGNMLAHLPQYLQIEEDYSGTAAVMDVLCHLYDLPEDLKESEAAIKQYEELNISIARNPEVKALVQRLEYMYDSRTAKQQEQSPETKDEPKLSKEVENFLKDIDKSFDKDGK